MKPSESICGTARIKRESWNDWTRDPQHALNAALLEYIDALEERVRTLESRAHYHAPSAKAAP
jgi:hypothetical protein